MYGRFRMPGNKAAPVIVGSFIGGLLFAVLAHLIMNGPSPFRSQEILLNVIAMAVLSVIFYLTAGYAQRRKSAA